jgi:DnaK suppressor protein
MIHAETQAAQPRYRKSTLPTRMPAAITEDQVRAMPDDQYMDDGQLAFFTSRLTELEAALVAKARRADIEIATGAVSADPVDRACVEEEHRMALSNRARDASQLRAIRAALARIAAGDFAYCSETGEPIGIARLLVQPTTVLTTDAQQRRESNSRRSRT